VLDVLVHRANDIVPWVMAELIKGAPIAAAIESAVREEVARTGAQVHLVALQAGEDPASDAYVRRQAQAAERVGMKYSVEKLPAGASERAVLDAVARLNGDPKVTGVIIQLPLPAGVRAETVQEALDPRKDVEGVHPASLGALVGDQPRLVPCTAAAVMACLASIGKDLTGLNAVVIGRSRIVGRPVALLLVQKNATVTVCHTKTRDLAAHLARADVVVVAAGRTALLKPEVVRPGSIVIDVGTNEVIRDGKRSLAGDADPAVAEVASFFTPVPGGVGPVTVALLWQNALNAWKLQQGPRVER
jgi:methylenetetrahydrofolate dehydrogenase (NADP+) / methenyltetrahydrofolate cyclohydrolase